MKKLEEMKGMTTSVNLHVLWNEKTPPWQYNGVLTEVNEKDCWIDDWVIGNIRLDRSKIISYHEHDFNELVRLSQKFPQARARVKLWQADDKVMNNVSKLKNLFR